MGESVTEGTVLGWLKQVGDRVEADEPLVEISTDKVDAEIPAPTAGTLVKIFAEADETVQVGSVLGEIEPDDGNGAAAAAEAPETPEAEPVDVTFPEMGDSVAEGTVLEWRVKVGRLRPQSMTRSWRSPPTRSTPRSPRPLRGPSPRSSSMRIRRSPSGRCSAGSPWNGWIERLRQPKAEVTEVKPATEASPSNGGNATPVAARIASAHGLDVDGITGSGPRGRVTKEDVLAAVEGNGAPAGAAGSSPSAAPRPRSSSS